MFFFFSLFVFNFSLKNEGPGSVVTHFPREKATCFGAKMHLELRSPMFGENCVLIFYRRHPMELIKSRGDLCQKSIVGSPPKSV